MKIQQIQKNIPTLIDGAREKEEITLGLSTKRPNLETAASHSRENRRKSCYEKKNCHYHMNKCNRSTYNYLTKNGASQESSLESKSLQRVNNLVESIQEIERREGEVAIATNPTQPMSLSPSLSLALSRYESTQSTRHSHKSNASRGI